MGAKRTVAKVAAKTAAKAVGRAFVNPVVNAGLTAYDVGDELYKIPQVRDAIARKVDYATGLDAKVKKALAPTPIRTAKKSGGVVKAKNPSKSAKQVKKPRK